jgi:hypothetical protein
MDWSAIWSKDVQDAVVQVIAYAVAFGFLWVSKHAAEWYAAGKAKLEQEAAGIADMTLRAVVLDLVKAAEQAFAKTGAELGADKYAKVLAWAQARGLDIDEADIEAAVAKLKAAQKPA